MTGKIDILVSEVIRKLKIHQLPGAFTVAVSGIDGAGKGHISKLLHEALCQKGYKVALVNIDPWQNPIPIRLRNENAAENIYEHIFRWNDFFEQLIFPLQKSRGIFLETTGIRSDADIYFPMKFDYQGIDILLLDGILLLKREYLPYYHFKIWIDCSFEIALQRALKRNIENLDEERLLHDYLTFYYPAQRYHFKKDHPKGTADLIFDNN